ncbi:MAG: biosynthetic peptidoglycan transglycosylase [Myxococcota bacterium]|nr:biosynthetic peptidoglycan transglycosylase [Myxococcota bacterium]
MHESAPRPDAPSPAAPAAVGGWPRWLVRWVLPALLGFALGVGGASGLRGWSERRAATELLAALQDSGLVAELGEVRLLRGPALEVRDLTLARPGQGSLTVRRAVAWPGSLGELRRGRAGSWTVRGEVWRGQLQLPGRELLRATGPEGTVQRSAGGLSATWRGTLDLPAPAPLTGRLQRSADEALTVAVELGRPVEVQELAGTLAYRLPPLVRGLAVDRASWDGRRRCVTLAGLTWPRPELGLEVTVAEAELRLDPDHQPRELAVRGLQGTVHLAQLDLARLAAQLRAPPEHGTPDASSPPADASPPPADASPPPAWLAPWLRPLPPPLAGLTRASWTAGRIRLVHPRGTLQLDALQGELLPGVSLINTGEVRGPLDTRGRLRLELGWPVWREAGVELTAAGELQEGSFAWGPVAPEPVSGLTVAGRGRLRWEPATRRLTSSADPVTANGLELRLLADLTLPETRPPAGSLVLGLAEQPCQRLADALPAGLAPLRQGLRLQGTAGGQLRLRFDLARREEPVTELAQQGRGLGQCTVEGLDGVAVARLATPFVQRIPSRKPGLPEVLVGPGTAGYVPLDEIPTHVRRSMLLTENSSFYEGGPVSLGLLRKALNIDLAGGGFVYGGSTISQQLVKNLFLGPEKNLARKLQEAFIAWQMEQTISKDRILELYVNCIEFGPGIYGLEAASQYYFGHGSRELTPVEGVFLATIKPLPSDGPRMARNGRIDGWWIKRVGEVMRTLEAEGEITPEQRAAAFPYQPRFRLAVERQQEACARDPTSVACVAPPWSRIEPGSWDEGPPAPPGVDQDAPPRAPAASRIPVARPGDEEVDSPAGLEP